MARIKILALILAGGAGNRMDVLTQERAKPALPFAGAYRLIDFPLSNCVHSGVENVWVVEQFEPHSLNDHLVNGRPWDLDRTYGGLRILPPFIGNQESGWHQGNADALYRNRRFIREYAPDVLLVLSSDHIYKFDYRQAIEAHQESGAAVTMVTTRVTKAEASRFGVVEVGDDGRVTGFEYKPDEPRSDIVTTEIFVYDPQQLLDTLDHLVEQHTAKQDDNGDQEPALKDFGDELLPMLVERGVAYAYPLDGYWRDVGTIASYWQTHMDLLQADPPLDLDAAHWPILTTGVQRVPARISAGAQIEDSMIAPGCEIRGRVVRSVLAPGVVVEEGATVEDAVLFHNVVVEVGATVTYAIVDTDVVIGRKSQIGQSMTEHAVDEQAIEKRIALVGQRAKVAANTHIPAGGRVAPATGK